MQTLEHASALAVVWDGAVDFGADGPRYQADLSGTELIAELRELFATQRRAEQLVCRYLADLADRIAQRRDAVLVAYADELHAARCFFGLGVRETRERVRVGRALRTLPCIEQAFIDGELSYSRVREVTRVATAQTEGDWLSLAQTLDMRAFERRVAGARAVQASAHGVEGVTADGGTTSEVLVAGGPMTASASNDIDSTWTEPADGQRVTMHWVSPKTVRVTFELPAEAWALVERALEGARHAGGTGLGDGQALQAVVRDALSAQTEGGDASDPRRSIVLYECRRCGRSELETGVGALELDQVHAASLGCGATVRDLESEGRTVTRGGPLPAAVRRTVMLRDRCRCRVPGCARRRYVDVHHLTAQALGGEHSRRNCLVLCTTHHELLHDGKLTITGDADHDLSFCDASGRPIVAVASVATHLGSSRDVVRLATVADRSLDDEPSGMHADSTAENVDVVSCRKPPLTGSRTPASRLVEVMGRRGGWTMDALIESSGLSRSRGSSNADLARAGRKGPEPLRNIRAGVNAARCHRAASLGPLTFNASKPSLAAVAKNFVPEHLERPPGMGVGALAATEEPLRGGFVNTVVRVGDTVRRSAGAWTPTVHRLLSHARKRGVSWVPEPLGHDERGREVLSFIPGDVPHEMPEWVWSEVVLTEVARALRQWHDATSSFDGAGAVWNFEVHEPAEVICHNDFAPYNGVFHEGRFVGAIDFDFCSPGPRLWDIVYTAYRYVPLMPPANEDVPDGGRERSPFSLAEMRSRLHTFLAAYASGSTKLCYSHDVVIDMAMERLEAAAAWTANHALKTGDSALENHARMYRAHAEWMSGTLRGEPAT